MHWPAWLSGSRPCTFLQLLICIPVSSSFALPSCVVPHLFAVAGEERNGEKCNVVPLLSPNSLAIFAARQIERIGLSIDIVYTKILCLVYVYYTFSASFFSLFYYPRVASILLPVDGRMLWKS